MIYKICDKNHYLKLIRYWKDHIIHNIKHTRYFVRVRLCYKNSSYNKKAFKNIAVLLSPNYIFEPEYRYIFNQNNHTKDKFGNKLCNNGRGIYQNGTKKIKITISFLKEMSSKNLDKEIIEEVLEFVKMKLNKKKKYKEVILKEYNQRSEFVGYYITF